MQRKKIKNPYETELRSINSSLNKIKNIINRPQKIKTDNPLKIELIEEKQKKRKKRISWLIGILSFIIVVLAPYVEHIINPQKTVPIQPKPNTIKGFINYPTWVSRGDEEMIALMLTNGSKLPIEQVKSLINYPQEAAIIITSNDGSSIANFEKIEVNETNTKTIKFRLEKKPPGKKELKITLEITSKTIPEILKNPPQSILISIKQMPLIKSFLLRLFQYLGILILFPIINHIVGNYAQSRLR